MRDRDLTYVMGTDTPLLFSSFLSGCCLHLALERCTYGYFCLSGMFLGAAFFLSKYFAVLLGLSYVVYLCLFVRDRRLLTGFVILFACTVPFGLLNLYWNYTHSWNEVISNLFYRNTGEYHYQSGHFAVWGRGTCHGRKDDILTDFRKFDGKNILILDKRNHDLENEFGQFFRDCEKRTVTVAGADFHLILGHGFLFTEYRDKVLSDIRRTFYNIPPWLPTKRCYFTEKYFSDTADHNPPASETPNAPIAPRHTGMQAAGPLHTRR